MTVVDTTPTPPDAAHTQPGGHPGGWEDETMTSSIQHQSHWDQAPGSSLAGTASGPLWVVAAMLLALALSIGDADAASRSKVGRYAMTAARCKAIGAGCRRNSNCCSGQCALQSSGRHSAMGVCVAA